MFSLLAHEDHHLCVITHDHIKHPHTCIFEYSQIWNSGTISYIRQCSFSPVSSRQPTTSPGQQSYHRATDSAMYRRQGLSYLRRKDAHYIVPYRWWEGVGLTQTQWSCPNLKVGRVRLWIRGPGQLRLRSCRFHPWRKLHLRRGLHIRDTAFEEWLWKLHHNIWTIWKNSWHMGGKAAWKATGLKMLIMYAYSIHMIVVSFPVTRSSGNSMLDAWHVSKLLE